MWFILVLSVFFQVLGIVLLNLTPRVDMRDGRGSVSCLEAPAYDLGPDATSLEMSVPLCRSASIQRVAIAAVVFVLAYLLWVMAARKAHRHGPTAVARVKGAVVVWSGLLLLIVAVFIGMLLAG